MSSLTNELPSALAVTVSVNADEIAADLVDGRTIIAPLGWYPRLAHPCLPPLLKAGTNFVNARNIS